MRTPAIGWMVCGIGVMLAASTLIGLRPRFLSQGETATAGSYSESGGDRGFERYPVTAHASGDRSVRSRFRTAIQIPPQGEVQIGSKGESTIPAHFRQVLGGVEMQGIAADEAGMPDSRHESEYQTGLASYYGIGFHGGPTANGETYDMHSMTAAHRELPFGTVVRVTRPKNGKSVIVRINNRGPWIEGRIIDLSREAARKLGMIREGVVPVTLEIVGESPRESGISKIAHGKNANP